jgi:hypothetical protein
MASQKLIRLPGCARQRELRGWSIADLWRRSGVSPISIAKAERGEGVSARTAQSVLRAFETTPISATARELFAAESLSMQEATG